MRLFLGASDEASRCWVGLIVLRFPGIFLNTPQGAVEKSWLAVQSAPIRMLKNVCMRCDSDPERSEEEQSRSGNPDPVGARFLVVPIRSGLLGMTG